MKIRVTYFFKIYLFIWFISDKENNVYNQIMELKLDKKNSKQIEKI
jgi:hypothetical protein